MKQHTESRSDWEKVKLMIHSDARISLDAEDRAKGLYDPNEEAEVEEFCTAVAVTPASDTNKPSRVS